jgi:endonuclease/exonuclease/phosphatase family metal-dependent hydrolase
MGFDVRHTDREVILVRAGMSASDFQITTTGKGEFPDHSRIPFPTGSIPFRRGWVSIDANVRGTPFRLVSTHLDFISPTIQQKQVATLLSGPAATEMPVVLVGDFNSPGDGSGPAYNHVIAAGFVDAAARAGAGDKPTFGQRPDLLNPASGLFTRIDFILLRGAFRVTEADVIGDKLNDRTPSRFWPSDHAAVVATLEFPAQLRDCEPIRRRLAEVQREIADTESELTVPDIPQQVRDSLERLLVRLRQERTRTQRELDACLAGDGTL